MPAESGPRRGSAPSGGSRSLNARRSPVAWLRDCRSARSQKGWVGHPRACAVRSTPTAGGPSTEPSKLTGARCEGHCDPSRPSWLAAGACVASSSASSRSAGHRSRSRRGWLWSIPSVRTCPCRTRRSTNRSSSKAVVSCAKSSIHACAAAGRCVGPRPTPRATSARASSRTW